MPTSGHNPVTSIFQGQSSISIKCLLTWSIFIPVLTYLQRIYVRVDIKNSNKKVRNLYHLNKVTCLFLNIIQKIHVTDLAVNFKKNYNIIKCMCLIHNYAVFTFLTWNEFVSYSNKINKDIKDI